MKKILLATSALVGFAGVAAAEVKLSGYAEMGIQGGNAGYETQFHNDVVINFDFSGATDGGLEFGGRVQLDDTNGSDPNGGPTFDDEAFWVSGSFGKVTMGETDGAFDWALSEIYMGTSIADDHSTHAGAYWFTGLDGTYDNQIVRYEYSFGDFAGAISAEMDDSGVGDAVLGLGVKWAGDMNGTAVNAGFGYQTANNVDVWGLSAGATMANGIDVRVGYADFDGSASWAGLGLGYTTGALLVQANYGSYDTPLGNVDGFGLVANYDLGGGAVLMAGYGSGDAASWNQAGTLAGSDSTFSLGIGLSF